MPPIDDTQDDIEKTESNLGVAQEADDNSIVQPFDPEKIKVRTIPVVVEQIVSRIIHDEIDLAPDFQRLRGVWDLQRKSRLIESLLLRIPIPVFYVAEDVNENWSVVDGLQRMSTLYEFITGGFPLTRLEYLTHRVGEHFADLPRPMQRRISETQLVINVIEAGTPEEVMFNIFSRINTGGLSLNGQEIRHALHKGPVRAYLQELAQLPEFLDATANSIDSKRMSDRECVLRYLAFTVDPWEKYAFNDLDGYLGRTMDKINAMSESERNAHADTFRRAMRAAKAIFGNDAFRKRKRREDGRNPISKALFEAWGVELAKRSPEEIDRLIQRREDVVDAFVKLMFEDREFEIAISYATGVPQRVSKRFRAIQNLVKEFI